MPGFQPLVVVVCLLVVFGTVLGHDNGPSVKVVVEEGSNAVLPCLISTKEDVTRKAFDWKKDGQQDVFFHSPEGHTNEDQQFRDRVSHFQDQLMNGNASIKIENTKMTDSGNYSCIFPYLQTFNIELVVERLLRDRAGEIQGASPEPYIRTVNATKDGSLLQCDVRGASPKPKVEWQDSAANILPAEEPQVSERGGRYYVTLKTTVTKTGSYRCVVTQEDIGHQTEAETFVFISGASPEPYIRTVNATKDGSLLQCDVRGASPKPKVEWLDSAANILPAEEPQVSERGGRYYVTLKTTVAKTGSYRCVVTQEDIGHQTEAETKEFISGASPEPYIRTVNATKDGSLLQCDVRGASPKPKVEWLDSAANILPAEEPQVSERGGRYYVTLKTTVAKTGSYRCVAAQEDIGHQTEAETFVFISEKLGEDPSTKVVTGWLFGGIVIGALVLAVVLAVLVATKRITVTCNRDSLQRRRASDDPNDQEIVMSSKSPLSNGDSHPPDDPETVMSSRSPLSNVGVL